ncbi:MAG: ATP-binding protein [Bacteroidales bacterium]|nr:ATP-binding protein [Bacteroidales bacterium]MBR4219136.1 ATP-binding protein [Bacteroidales bacterium]
MVFEYPVQGGDFTNAGTVSSKVKKMMRQLGVDAGVIKRTIVALYEAEVNIVAHAYKGVITVQLDSDKIYIKLDDEGPGIPDINQAMQRGYSTASPEVREMGFGAGMGLPNIKANSDVLEVHSVVGKGTTVEITNNF